jgi:hypothetical protein
MFPVPPTKRTFRLIKRLLAADGSTAAMGFCGSPGLPATPKRRTFA